MAVMIAGTLALFILNVGSIVLGVGIAVGYYLYRQQRSDQSSLIVAGRVATRSGLAGAVLAIAGTILIAGSSGAVARVVVGDTVAHRGDVLLGTAVAVDACTPAGQTSMFATSDPIYFVAVMRETVQPGSHVVYEIDGPGATAGLFPVTVPPPFDCLYTTESSGPLAPGSYVVRYRYDGQPATADLAKGTFTVTAAPRESPTSGGESTARAASPSSAAPSVVESNLPASCLPPPHAASELEASLPTNIAGRTLAIESFHGALMVTCLNGGTATDVAHLSAALAADGLSLDDISVAVAGRSDVENDPPYFIFAYHVAGHPGSEWPSTVGIDYPDAAGFREADIEGKHVLVGDTAAIDQSEHLRGRPYLWNSSTVHYLIVTDDEAWAGEVLRALH
jgi:hypothetical protein